MSVKVCPMGVCGVLPEKWNFCPVHGLELVTVEEAEPSEEEPYRLPYNLLKKVMCPCDHTFQYHQRPMYCPNCGHALHFALGFEGPEDAPQLL